MDLSDFELKNLKRTNGYRLVNSRFPPISLFDDVADTNEFDALYAVQKLTNPRLLNELGDLNLLPRDEIPFGIAGCNYATAPFTHVSPDGSRFSDGSFGMLYVADEMETAIEETVYHQECYFKGIPGLHFDCIVMRGLKIEFSCQVLDIHNANDDIYDPDNYTYSRVLGILAKNSGHQALEYKSVRRDGHICWGLFTPKGVNSAIQTEHYEYVWDGHRISHVNQLTPIR